MSCEELPGKDWIHPCQARARAGSRHSGHLPRPCAVGRGGRSARPQCRANPASCLRNSPSIMKRTFAPDASSCRLFATPPWWPLPKRRACPAGKFSVGSRLLSLSLRIFFDRSEQLGEGIGKQLDAVGRELVGYFFDRDDGLREVVHHLLRARDVLAKTV